jgi:Skp family chaperone for outer membrane proteins
MGYDKDIIATLPHSQEIIFNSEKLTRYSDIDEYPFTSSPDSSTDAIDVFECYVRLDFDGDGLAELRKITVVGDTSDAILDNVEVDSIPFCSLTPIPMPHRFYGRSVSELVQDIQLIKSTVLRQLLDNMYLTNNNRIAIMDGMVNLDDLLTARPGGVVRTKQPPSQVMLPMQNQTISAQAFPLLEYLDTVRETRTGVTRYAQGLDADSLNKTATGINTLMTQTQMRMELIARIFAETGVKELFEKIFELTVKYQEVERLVQLNNVFIPVRPTEWKDKYNINIVVGLGSGSKEQQLVILNSILEKQLQAFTLQGNKEYPMVTLKNIYNTLSKMIENAGLKNTENYFVNPDVGMQYVQPPQPPALTPIEKIEFTRIDAENKRKQADLQLQMQELDMKNSKMQLDFQSKIKELELKYSTQIDSAKIKQEADLNKIIVSNLAKNFSESQKATQQLEQEIQRAQNINGTTGSGETPIGS